MKKTLLFAASLLFALCMNAAPYMHSVGANVGGINGASYKGFIFPVENLFIQADLGVKVSATKGVTMSYRSEGIKFTDSFSTPFVYYTFEANPNVGYQGDIAEVSFGSFHWYAGGGVSLGMIQVGNNWNDIKEARNGDHPYGLKFGVNALGGVELCIKDAPLNVGVDFRPGYGLEGFGPKCRNTMSFFDWALAASLRYRF